MKTAFVTLLGTSAAMASDIYIQDTDNGVDALNLRVIDGNGDADTTGTVSGAAGANPTVSAGFSIECRKDARSTTELGGNAGDLSSRPAAGDFRGTFVQSCTITADSGASVQVIPPKGAAGGDTVLVSDAGSCAEISFTAPTQKDISARTFDAFAHGGVNDNCVSGRRKTEPDVGSLTVNVEFTVGAIDSRLSDFVTGAPDIRKENVDGSETYNLGIDHPAANYFADTCPNCFGAVKVEYMNGGDIYHIQRGAGFALADQLTTVNDMKRTASNPAPTVFELALAEALYSIDQDDASTQDVNLLTGTISCGGNGAYQIPAYITGADRAARCRQILPTAHAVSCDNAGANGAGFIDMDGDSFAYAWDTTKLNQFAAPPTAPAAATKSVSFADFQKKVELSWSDGKSAIVGNSLTLAAQGDESSTVSFGIEIRTNCDLSVVDVAYPYTLSSAASYAAGPTIEQGPTQQYQKYAVGAQAGISHPNVKWCSDGLDEIATSCTGAFGDVRPAGATHALLQESNGEEFRGCKGATDQDIGDELTFIDDAGATTYLPSAVECAAISQVNVGSVVLDYGVSFALDAFADSGSIVVSTGQSSLVGASLSAEDYYFSQQAECQADGTVGTAAAGCGAEALNDYNSIRDKFACGSNEIMYINHHLTFAMNNDGTVLKFCNSKRLSYSVEEQSGVLSVSITAEQRVGSSAHVELNNLRWEQCAGGFQQMMLLDFSTDDTGTLTDSDVSVSTNAHLHLDADGTNLAVGRIMFKSSCVDVCADPDQMHDTAKTDFSIALSDSTPTYTVSSQLQGNPCADSETVDGIPDMVLKVADEGACSGSAPATSALTVTQGNSACFYLDLEDSNTDVTGRSLSATWALTDASGDSLTLAGETGSGWSLGNSIAIPDDGTMSGEALTLHVDFTQSRSSGGGYRRLRATYLLGAKDAGDAEASFTVLPAHISVLDASTDSNDTAPAEEKKTDDSVRIAVYVLVAMGGVATLVYVGEKTGIIGGKRKSEGQAYAPVGRFASVTKY